MTLCGASTGILRPPLTTSELKSGTSLSSNQDPLKADFRNFLWLCWKHLGLPDPTPVQYEIARWLQHGPKRAILSAFRGVGKSWITSAFVCWLLYCNPQLNILVVSASKNRSDDFSTFTLRLIKEMEILQFLIPGSDQRESKVAFDVAPAQASHAPSVKSMGITGQITGSRADIIIADDIEVANNSDTQTKRDKLSEAVKEFDAILKPDSPVGRILFLGTPQSEQSIYNTLTDERGYVMRIWSALYPTEEQVLKYGNKLAPSISLALQDDTELEGKPTDPNRFSAQDLAERLLSYGRSGFALQFMLDTSLSDADKYPLKVADLIIMGLNPRRAPSDVIWSSSPDLIHNDITNVAMPGDKMYRPMFISEDWLDYEGGVMFIDPSGRGKDETSYAVVKMLQGRLFLTKAGGFKGNGYDDAALRNLLTIAKNQAVNKIIVEPNFGDGMFAQLLKAQAKVIYPVSIEDAEWSKTNKEARIIDCLEPVMNQHRLVVCSSVIEDDYKSTIGYQENDERYCRLVYQMTRLTRDKGSLAHDDRIDALAGAVQYWLDRMARNSDKAEEQRKEDLLQKELDRYLDNVMGRKPQGNTFMGTFQGHMSR